METPHNLEWRIAAKIVAVVDLILSFFALVLLLVVLAFGVELEDDLEREKLRIVETGGHGFENLGLTIVIVTIWAALFLYEVVVFVELYAATGLFTATKLETDILKAFGHSWYWIRVHACCIVLGAVFHFATGFIWAWVLESLVRTGAIYIVFKYTKELNEVIAAAEIEIQVTRKNTRKIANEKTAEVDDKKIDTKILLDF